MNAFRRGSALHFALVVGAACARLARADDEAQLLKDAQGVFQQLPRDFATKGRPVTPERVELGRKLFFDPRLSIDGTVSCSRCHLAALAGTDALPKSHGARDKSAPRNAPTVLNAARQFKQHWRGEFESVEEQAQKALRGAGLANPDDATVLARLKAIPGYSELFQRAFPGEREPLSVASLGRAIGAYERTLVSPSRFDEFLGGKSEALSPQERRGLRTFLKVGCADCHSGAGVGGDSFEKFGVLRPYPPETRSAEIDHGRFGLTKRADDEAVFKVPGLRNVAVTPPYFHDGSTDTLSEAVRIMAYVQLDRRLTPEETGELVSFLESLTGIVPAHFAEAPTLPAAGFKAETR